MVILTIQDFQQTHSRLFFLMSLILGLISESTFASNNTLPHYIDRPAQDEVIYFVLADRFENGSQKNDRGGIPGGRLAHGFDPKHKGFYHGGDLKGLTQRLDYLADMGITAVWLAPIFKNRPVQGIPPHISAGYHGYWILDFTDVDPHLGTKADFKTLVDEAHKRNMKVIMDIVTNHTADVIAYRECHDPAWQGEKVARCDYRSKHDYPYTTHHGKHGKAINQHFISDQPPHQTLENFAELKDSNYAYTPFIKDRDKNAKTPAWLNNINYYHNRGDTSFEGENSLYGDFMGLDDIFTEHPRVVEGFIDIYKKWISDYKVDGFRIDTAKHVNPEFWQAFVPAMLEHAKQEGIPNFYVFGEVYAFEPSTLAKITRLDSFPAVLDFAYQRAIIDILTNKAGPSRLSQILAEDILYPKASETTNMMPTFVSNHDLGRLGHFLYRDIPNLSEQEALSRAILAHALVIYGRGVPVVYYGDEQGFTGDGNDQDARESLFPSHVDVYNDNELIGTDATTAIANFDKQHPLYKAIKGMATVYHREPSLRYGIQTMLHTGDNQGILAFSRKLKKGDNPDEVIVIMNTSTKVKTTKIKLAHRVRLQSLVGRCPKTVNGDNTLVTQVAALDFILCKVK